MKKLGIGMIGCGTISPVHLEAIVSSDQAQLISVCDINIDRLSQVKETYHCDGVEDYHMILEDDRVQVVHILLPHDLHTKVAIEALKAGKDVVLEKPVGISFEQLKEIEGAQLKYKGVVGITLQNRFNPTSIAMKAVVESGVLGRLIGSKGIVAWHRDDLYYRESDWRGRKVREGGGLLINQAIHTLDLMAYIGGEVDRLKGMIGNHYHGDTDVEDVAAVSIFYKSGAIGNFYGTNNHGTNSNVELEFVFEKGTLRLLDQNVTITQDQRTTLIATDIISEGAKSYWGQGHKDCINSIYESMINKKPLIISLREAIKATELVLGTYESSSKNAVYYMVNT